MIIGITMLAVSLIYLILTGVTYFTKKRLNNKENKRQTDCRKEGERCSSSALFSFQYAHRDDRGT